MKGTKEGGWKEGRNEGEKREGGRSEGGTFLEAHHQGGMEEESKEEPCREKEGIRG